MSSILFMEVTIKNGESLLVSACDYDRVTKHDWKLWNGYPHHSDIGSLHHFILGEKPDDIPENYVIDHVNRNKLDARRNNLRWVSKSFNIFNSAIQDNTTSRFKGVSLFKKSNKWRAVFRTKHVGTFLEERDAAKAYARSAVAYWPKWAPSSDLLVGPELLTFEEMNQITEQLSINQTEIKKERYLPVGVSLSRQKYYAKYCGKHLGCFDSAEEAGRIYLEYKMKVVADDWETYSQTPILRDEAGHAIIKLSGKAATGKFSKVPDRFWHRLTFNSKWNIKCQYAAGLFEGINNYLHIIVYRLCHPDKPILGTIDHIDPAAKLNNLETNLRDATLEMQARNKQKKTGCTSKYIGVHQNISGKWIGRVYIKRKRYCTKWMNTEHAAAVALKTIKDEHGIESRQLSSLG